MKLTMQHNHRETDLTDLVGSVTWSGDQATISRAVSCALVHPTGSSLPLPELGDNLFLDVGGERIFAGVLLRRSMSSEGQVVHCDSFDLGYYLQRNHGTWRFDGTTPEQITATICSERGISVRELPQTGVSLRRKFAGTPLAQIVKTVWTLAGEQNGKTYACRYGPDGLIVRERSVSRSSVILDASANLMDAATTEDASKMTNRVAIYDAQGNLIRKLGDAASQQRFGVMEQHLRQSQEEAAKAQQEAQRLLREQGLSQTVTVHVLGEDPRLLAGETVEVRDPSVGLRGLFWIEADRHTWKDGLCTVQLSLNCKNRLPGTWAGSEWK